MSDPAQNIITTPAQVYQDHAQNIASHLNQAGHVTSSQEIIPVTADTPVPQTSVLQQVGAQIVNGEDLQSKLKDLEYIAEADFKKGDKIRTTESKGFLDTLLGKLMRKKQKNEEIVEK